METVERGVTRKGRRATSLLVRAVCVPQGSPWRRPPQPPLAPPHGAASVPRHGSSTAQWICALYTLMALPSPGAENSFSSWGKLDGLLPS